jgi:murein DD-endopeptidase MepM/ murein hydrolase activator NlpD
MKPLVNILTWFSNEHGRFFRPRWLPTYLLLVCLALFSIGSAVVVDHPHVDEVGAISTMRAAAGGSGEAEELGPVSFTALRYDSEETNVHIVEDGDDLWTLASDYGTSVEAIVRTNRFTYARRLRPGQQLSIPASGTEGYDPMNLCQPHMDWFPRSAEQMDWPPLTKTTHTVKPGENLWAIARQYGVDVPTLFGANEQLDGGYIFPGDRLVVPSQKGVLVTVKKEKSLSEIADRYRVPLATVARANHLEHNAPLQPEQEIFVPGGRPLDRGTFIWPLVNFGRISSGFGYRTHPVYRRRMWHSGIDLTAGYGTPIRAARSGRVTGCGWNGGLGNTVVIRHDNGFQTVYGHCSKIRVKRNQYVKKGQVIASVGSTGLATGPHLHFEVRKGGRAVNPLRYLPYW